MKERKNMDKLKRTVQMLNKYPMQYLGVIGLDGKPKVKAFEFKFEENGKLYFDVIRGSETYKELSVNPYCEITVASRKDLEWIRISGKVRFVNEVYLRDKLFDHSEILSQKYGHIRELVMPFTLDDVHVSISNLNDQNNVSFDL